MQEAILSIQNLSVRFHGKNNVQEALKQVNITVNKGELVAVVGESGSGKSVTSLSVLQLIPAPPIEYTQGSIMLHTNKQTQDMLQASVESLQAIRGHDVAMIFQEPMSSLNPVMTCGEQVMEALQQHKKLTKEQAKQATIQLFEQVQLPNPVALLKKYPHQMSGGQKQRVMIAMAISCEPALLICDEPTTALDVTVQKSILTLIKSLQLQQQMGILFITHDLGVVAEIADRVLVMYKGAIVESGTTKDIFSNPVHPYTKALLACRPSIHAKHQQLPVVSDFLTIDDQGQIIEKIWKPQQASMVSQTDLPKEVLLKVENLAVHYPTSQANFWGKPKQVFKAIDQISFELYKGETLGLVGESGCGKSTLGKAIVQLVAPNAGRILYKNIDLAKATKAEKQQWNKSIQMIFQDPFASLNPNQTIGAAIAEPMLVHGLVQDKHAAKKKVLELLAQVGLQTMHYSRYPHEFSGGQRQRIVIARALAVQPACIICDESVSALDVSVQAQILNLLNSLKKALGFTILFISHDLGVVHYISDRIMVMQKGRIEEIGMATTVYNQPSSDYTKKLIDAMPKVALPLFSTDSSL